MSQNDDLLLAFHSFVMADALLVGNSSFSSAASWLSLGWIWAFPKDAHFERNILGGSSLPPNANLFRWNDKGVVDIANIQPPRWPRQASMST